jgi:hypothetical protein
MVDPDADYSSRRGAAIRSGAARYHGTQTLQLEAITLDELIEKERPFDPADRNFEPADRTRDATHES